MCELGSKTIVTFHTSCTLNLNPPTLTFCPLFSIPLGPQSSSSGIKDLCYLTSDLFKASCPRVLTILGPFVLKSSQSGVFETIRSIVFQVFFIFRTVQNIALFFMKLCSVDPQVLGSQPHVLLSPGFLNIYDLVL
jgi:hypothetical protein